MTALRTNALTFNWAGNQQVRGGLSVNVPVTSANASVGVMTPGSVTIGPATTSATTAFDPAGVGNTTITVGVPGGFDTPGNFRQIAANVN